MSKQQGHHHLAESLPKVWLFLTLLGPSLEAFYEGRISSLHVHHQCTPVLSASARVILSLEDRPELENCVVMNENKPVVLFPAPGGPP